MNRRFQKNLYIIGLGAFSIASSALGTENLSDGWQVFEIGVGIKPAFVFDLQDRMHVMALTKEDFDGVVWYAVSNHPSGPWELNTVGVGYFYGPGDIVVSGAGDIHIAVHDHNGPNPVHLLINSVGGLTINPIETPQQHDGWDNALALDSSGGLHMSTIYPVGFGAVNSLQYGYFDGESWDFPRSIEGSGAGMYGLNTSIAIDSAGVPHLAYCLTGGFTDPGELRYAVQSGDEWVISTVVSGGIRGRFPSLAIDSRDRPHLAWADGDAENQSSLKFMYAVLDEGQWHMELVDTLTNAELSFSEARRSVSLVLDSQDRPRLAFADKRTIRYAEQNNGAWTISTILEFSEDKYKGMVDLELDSREAPAIVFWERSDESEGLVRLLRAASGDSPSEVVLGGANNPVAGLVDWFFSPWYGFFNTTFAPWIFHEHHGFNFLAAESTSDSVFLFDPVIDAWYFTSPVVYPNLFLFDGQGWLFFFNETGNPRAFVRLDDGEFLFFDRAE